MFNLIKRIGIVLILFALMLIPATAEFTQEFFDNFEDQNFDDWDNTDWEIDNNPAIGSYSALCDSTNTCDMHIITQTDTSTATTVKVLFSYYDVNCDAGGDGDAVVYFNSTSGWGTAIKIDAGSLGTSQGQWNDYSWESSDSAYLFEGFSVRFWADPEGGAGAETYNVDNVTIQTETVSDTCTCAGLNQNWEIDMSDYCVISDDCDLGTGEMTFINEGNVSCKATITLSKRARPTTGQKFFFYPTCHIKRG